MQFRRIGCLASLLIVLTITTAKAQYYSYDQTTKTLTEAQNGDPDSQTPIEWQVWLYRRGLPANGGQGAWGSLTGSTAAKVMAELKRDQDVEIRFNKFFSVSDDEDPLTYTNPLGPIAIFRSKPLIIPDALEAYNRMNELNENIQQAMDIYDNALKLAGEKQDAEETVPNSHMGEVLKDYGNALEAANEKLTDLMNQLDNLNSSNLDTINSTLNTISSDLKSEATEFKPVGDQLGAYASSPEANVGTWYCKGEGTGDDGSGDNVLFEEFSLPFKGPLNPIAENKQHYEAQFSSYLDAGFTWTVSPTVSCVGFPAGDPEAQKDYLNQFNALDGAEHAKIMWSP